MFPSWHKKEGTPIPTFQQQRIQASKKCPKKTKAEQSIWCQVCNIGFHSKIFLDQHILGKKHLKNFANLKERTAIIPRSTPTITKETVSTATIAATAPTITVGPFHTITDRGFGDKEKKSFGRTSNN